MFTKNNIEIKNILKVLLIFLLGFLSVTYISYTVKIDNNYPINIQVNNNDSGYLDEDDENVNYGSKLSEKLTKQNSDKKSKLATITIPKNFSDKLMGNEEKPEIDVVLNKHNTYFENVLLKNQLNRAITNFNYELLTGTDFEKENELTKTVNSIVETTKKINQSLSGLSINGDTKDLLNTTNDNLTDVVSGLSKASVALNNAIASGDNEAMSEAATQIQTNSYELQSKVQQNLNQLANNSADVISAKDNDSSLKTDIDKLASYNDKLKSLTSNSSEDNIVNTINLKYSSHNNTLLVNILLVVAIVAMYIMAFCFINKQAPIIIELEDHPFMTWFKKSVVYFFEMLGAAIVITLSVNIVINNWTIAVLYQILTLTFVGIAILQGIWMLKIVSKKCFAYIMFVISIIQLGTIQVAFLGNYSLSWLKAMYEYMPLKFALELYDSQNYTSFNNLTNSLIIYAIAFIIFVGIIMVVFRRQQIKKYVNYVEG